jgi:hypothetical protein
MLFESGARIREILSLTCETASMRLRDRAKSISKAATEKRVKEVWWSSDTGRLLQRHIKRTGGKRSAAPKAERVADFTRYS